MRYDLLTQLGHCVARTSNLAAGRGFRIGFVSKLIEVHRFLGVGGGDCLQGIGRGVLVRRQSQAREDCFAFNEPALDTAPNDEKQLEVTSSADAVLHLAVGTERRC